MAFLKYKKLSGDSGVTAYEPGNDYIKVMFGGWVYVYNYTRPGKKHVEHMKQLADAGKGLSTYISQKVKDKYDKKYLI